MTHNIGYNSQRNNPNFGGKFPGSWQCFSTCSWMAMSFYTDKIDAKDDTGLSRFVDYVSNAVGDAGYPKTTLHSQNGITPAENSAFFWEVQAAGIESMLYRFGVDGSCVYRDGDMTFDELDKVLEFHPVIIGTSKLGGLPGGHIILIVGKDDAGNYVVNDPYGDAKTKYQDPDGEKVLYSREMLQFYTTTRKTCRAIYFDRMGA